MLIYLIWASNPLFLWYTEHTPLVLVIGHSLSCLNKKQFFYLTKWFKSVSILLKRNHAAFIMTPYIFLGLSSRFFILINESKTSVLILLSNMYFP